MKVFVVKVGDLCRVPDTDLRITYRGPTWPALVERINPSVPHVPRQWFVFPGSMLVVANRVMNGSVLSPVEVTVCVQPLGDRARVTVFESGGSESGCVFCGIVTGVEPAVVVREWPDAVAFTPHDPVVDGHTLVVPKVHVADAVVDPGVTGMVMRRAAEFAKRFGASNILTSVGQSATQSVFHLHAHVIPRERGDGLMLPWGTTGDPHAPHRCGGMDELAAELVTLRGWASSLELPFDRDRQGRRHVS